MLTCCSVVSSWRCCKALGWMLLSANGSIGQTLVSTVAYLDDDVVDDCLVSGTADQRELELFRPGTSRCASLKTDEPVPAKGIDAIRGNRVA